MKILLTIEDISYGRGAERVTVNFANAFAEHGHEVSIISFYQRHPDLPYTTINPSVNLIFKYNYEQNIAQEKAKCQRFPHFVERGTRTAQMAFKHNNLAMISTEDFSVFTMPLNEKYDFLESFEDFGFTITNIALLSVAS